MTDPTIEVQRAADLDVRTWHDLVRLRIDVFVVEQACAYAELDGRDLEPDALHLWSRDDNRDVSAYLRLLTDPGAARRIGRVCTAPAHRGSGLAARLLARALAECGPAEVRLEAQSHLAGWYARAGFEVAGEEYVEDGIPHVPMLRPGRPGTPSAVPAAGSAVHPVEVMPNLNVADLARARRFCAEVLGLTEERMDIGWVLRLASPDDAATVQLVTGDATAPEDSQLTVKVGDVDAAYDAARRAGHEVVHPLTDEPWGIRRFLVRVPGGPVVNVARHRAPG